MFVNDKEIVKITLYYKPLKSGRLQVLPKIEHLGEQKLGFVAVNFDMRVLTWRQTNELMRQSRRLNAMQQSELDWELYKEKRLVALIVNWDAKEGDQPVPLTPDNILKMNPQVAELLLYEYEHAME